MTPTRCLTSSFQLIVGLLAKTSCITVRYMPCFSDVLSEKMPRPFKFLDIACGDASASVAALKNTSIAHYYGIDLSARSLELASENLKVLPCPFELRCCDFADAMADWSKPVDVAWIGMSLHHLQLREKAQLMKNMHKTIASSGLFLIWEPTLLEGETRAEWLDRFAGLRRAFAAITEDEFQAMESQHEACRFPRVELTRGLRWDARRALAKPKNSL